jgi:spore maturation protein CgeB
LNIYFVSEELGCGIFQTNDEEGEYFTDKYIFVSTDDMCYYESFEELKKDVQDYLEVNTDFESVEDMQEALDEANKKDDSKIGSVYEVEYVDLMY